MIAPPTFLYSVFAPGIWPGFAGLQSFQGGNSWDFKRPLRLGDHLIPTATLMDVKDVQGKRSGRTIIEEGFTEFHTPAGELVATAVSRSFRKPRAGYKDAMRVEPRAPHKLGDAEIEELEARIISYVRRGSVPRYWEDTKVGQRLDERIKGPLQLSDVIDFWIGIGYIDGGEAAVKRRQHFRQHPEDAPNCRPLPYWTDRIPWSQGHVDSTLAQTLGISSFYDTGFQRTSWIGQMLTDWMGDDAELLLLETKLRLPNMGGDLLTLSGEVTRHYVDGTDRRLADLAVFGHRQDGELSLDGTATIRLPSKQAESLEPVT
jgi:acyl dehydratase